MASITPPSGTSLTDFYPTSNTPPDRATPNVAVVVVHGVADQAPFESAESIAAMLGRAAPEAACGYAPFSAEAVRLPLAPVGTKAAETRAWHARDRSRVSEIFDERSTYVSAARRSGPNAAPIDESSDTDGHGGGFSHAFMTSQLDGYESRDSVYETRRFTSTRATPDGSGPAANVHVYEAYWADLSRLKSGVFSFVGELYQLLFHLGNLGSQALDFAYIENRGSLWRWASRTYAWSVRMLTLPIALLNVVALVAAFAVMPAAMLSGPLEPIVAAAIAAVFGTLASCSALWWWARRRNVGSAPAKRAPGLLTWLVVPPAGALAGAGLVLWLGRGALGTAGTLAIEWWVVCLAPFLLLVSSYEKLRPGAVLVGALTYGGAGLAHAAFVWHFATMPSTVTSASEYGALWTFRLLFGALQLSWLVLGVCAIVSIVAAWLAVRVMPRRTAADRARRARAADACTTARLALSLPAIGFTAVTVTIWSALYFCVAGYTTLYRDVDVTQLEAPAGAALVVDWMAPPPRVVVPMMHDCVWSGDDATRAERLRHALRGEDTGCPSPDTKMLVLDYLHGLIMTKAGTGWVMTLGIVVICLVAYVTMSGPSLLAEVLQSRDKPWDTLDDAERRAAHASSRTFGQWMDRGQSGVPVLTWVLWAAAFVVPFVFVVPYAVIAFADANWAVAMLMHVGPSTRAVLDAAGVISVGSGIVGVGVVAFSGVLTDATAMLDVMLDVDNYMRTRPVDRTPRARIAERYTSLLRYLSAWEGEGKRGYDHVVFVAHSLGTVITVDLLRYLREIDDPVPNSKLGRLGLTHGAEPEVGLHLMTMGSPLRQLFGRFFPHLYGWTRAADADAASPLPSAIPVGVSRWVNAYRSGDYVGRGLWSETRGAHAYDRTGEPAPLDAEGRADWCLGAGAHTHYWDDTTPDLAAHLDLLILSTVRQPA